MSKTYDPTQVSITLGINKLDNWDEVTVAFDEDAWTFTSGTQGEATRTKNANRLGTITITCPQTSSANDILSSWFVTGLGFPCMVKDNNGTSVGSMLFGTVTKLPDVALAKESGSREWMIKGKLSVGPAVGWVGGNDNDVASQTYSS
jgi:hypothetical protein